MVSLWQPHRPDDSRTGPGVETSHLGVAGDRSRGRHGLWGTAHRGHAACLCAVVPTITAGHGQGPSACTAHSWRFSRGPVSPSGFRCDLVHRHQGTWTRFHVLWLAGQGCSVFPPQRPPHSLVVTTVTVPGLQRS